MSLYLDYDEKTNNIIMKSIIKAKFPEPLTSTLLSKGFHFNLKIESNKFIENIHKYNVSNELLAHLLDSY